MADPFAYTGHRYPSTPVGECKHERLGFHSGGFIIGCADCHCCWHVNTEGEENVGAWYLKNGGHLTMHDLRVSRELAAAAEPSRPVALDALSRAHIGRALSNKGMGDFGVRQSLEEIDAILSSARRASNADG